MPSLWLADGLGQDTCFLDNGFLFTIGANCVTKAKSPQFKISDSNVYMSAISFNNFVTSLSANNHLDAFDLQDSSLSKGFCIGLICPRCGEVSRDATNFKRHMTHHQQPPVKCDRCKQKFDKIDLKDHLKNCVYICPWRGDGCKVTNTRKEKHEAHIRKHKSMLNPEDYDDMDI